MTAPSGIDELGLRRAMSDRMLPLLVGAMAFLAALSLAGWTGSAALARHWQEGAGGSLTVQVPDPQDRAPQGVASRLAAALAALAETPGVASARALSQQELTDLLKPWLGSAADKLAIPVPAVIAVRLSDSGEPLDGLAERLAAAAPGTVLEDQGIWIRRLADLARSVQACAGLAVLLVAAVAASVVVVATRAGLSSRREAIEILHGLGATDSYIADSFARRATALAGFGAACGAVAALPVLLALARLAEPFSGRPVLDNGWIEDAATSLPLILWLALPALPAAAAAIGFFSAQGAVRRWLRRLP